MGPSSASAFSVVAVALSVLAGCGSQSDVPAGLRQATAGDRALHVGVFHGESFSSAAAQSSCGTDKSGHLVGKFKASGSAGGPFPGSFVQGGKIVPKTDNGSFYYLWASRFRVKSGSQVVGGYENARYSAFPASCSSGELIFSLEAHYHIGRYRTGGEAFPSLSGAAFSESFQ